MECIQKQQMHAEMMSLKGIGAEISMFHSLCKPNAWGRVSLKQETL